MVISDRLNLLKNSIEDYKIRKVCIDLASKCKNEIDKINFIHNDFKRGDTCDVEDDSWQEIKFSFLDQYDLDEEDYNFLFSEIEYICFDKERFSKHENEIITKFKKIILDGEDFKKKFKLFIFSSYFEEPEMHYKYEIEMLRDYINDTRKELTFEYSENELLSLDKLKDSIDKI